MGKLSVIVGGQYGSEAKGAVCAHLVRRNMEKGIKSVVVRVAGPNAGHTAYDDTGRAWALRSVPVGMVADLDAVGVIADGSEVDLPVLLQEVADLDAAGLDVSSRLFISGRVTMLTDAHHFEESPERRNLHKTIGSTGKGIGAARAARIMRTAQTPDLILADESIYESMWHFLVAEYDESLKQWDDQPERTEELREVMGRIQWVDGSTVSMIERHLAQGAHVMIEGTQGYGLGLHRPEYPRVTSSDTRAIDFLAMAGINPWTSFVDPNGFSVWVVVRAFPIRVAGNSGPLFEETSWEELGLPVELTTVTKKPRRVGRWDDALFAAAVRANGVDVVKVAYSMADQECPEIAGFNGPTEGENAVSWASLPAAARDEIDKINRRTRGMVRYIGTGPNSALWMDA